MQIVLLKFKVFESNSDITGLSEIMQLIRSDHFFFTLSEAF